MSKYVKIPDVGLDPWKNFYRERSRQKYGQRFIIRSYGLCQSEKVIFLWKNSQEFYRLERDIDTHRGKGDQDTLRKEYFQGELKREYFGQQNCFIEFYELFRKKRTFPKQEEFFLAGQVLKLEEGILKIYIEFYQQWFGSKDEHKN